MFNKLVASQGRKRGGGNPTTVMVSLVVHALLLAGAVYATVSTPEVKKEEELVDYFEVPEPEPPAPEVEEPEPPPPPEPETPPATPPPPEGFQELVPPAEPPPEIPEVDTSALEVKAEDFSGIGVAGGISGGVEGGVQQNTAAVDSSNFAFETAVLERQPEPRNLAQFRSYIERNYPPRLRDAGIGGTVNLEFVIEADGRVQESSVKVLESTHEDFAEASKEAIQRLRFRPGRYQGRDVRVLVRMPITWQPGR